MCGKIVYMLLAYVNKSLNWALVLPQFSIMAKYEVPIPEEVRTMLGNLSPQWDHFKETLAEADVMLKKHKVRRTSRPDTG